MFAGVWTRLCPSTLQFRSGLSVPRAVCAGHTTACHGVKSVFHSGLKRVVCVFQPSAISLASSNKAFVSQGGNLCSSLMAPLISHASKSSCEAQNLQHHGCPATTYPHIHQHRQAHTQQAIQAPSWITK